jgi:hypothetical protein
MPDPMNKQQAKAFTERQLARRGLDDAEHEVRPASV